MINDLDFLEAGFSEELSNAVNFESLEEGVIKDLISSLKRKFKKANGKRSNYIKKTLKDNKSKKVSIPQVLPQAEQEAREALCNEVFKATKSIFTKVLSKYPKVANVLGTYDQPNADDYDDFVRWGENNSISIGCYDIWDHPDIISGKLNARFNLDNDKLSIWDDEEFCKELEDAQDEIVAEIDKLEYGKADFDCDWDEGFFTINLDGAKSKEFIKKFLEDLYKAHPDMDPKNKQKAVDEFACDLFAAVDKSFANSFDLFSESLTEEPNLSCLHFLYNARYCHDTREVKDTEAFFNPSELEKDLVNGQDEVEDVTADSEQAPSVFDANGITQTSNNIIDKEDDINRNAPTLEDPTDGHGTLEEPVVNNEAMVISGKDIYYNKDAFVNGDINLCFITGLSGSGKSSMAQTMTRKAENLEHYDMDEVIFNKQNHPDEAWYKDRGDMIHKFFFAGPGKKYFIDRKDIDEALHMDENKYREEITKAFVDFAISYANSHKKIKFIIEGVWLYRFIPASKFKPYALCIKGTSAATSIYRASKRDKDSIGKLKRAGSWVNDEAKLNAYRKMYARSDETVRESNNYYSTSSSGIDFEYYSAYQSYLESTIDNEFKLQSLLVKDYALTESNIILEARIQDTVKNKWETFTNFILRIIDRFTAAIEKLLINNNGFLNKYKSNIVDTDPSDTIEYEYVGDYFEGVDRILNTPLPVFNYERDAQWLRQDGYEGAVKDFMAGKNFKYSPDQDLAAQFKNWFLATERGTSKGKLSGLNFKKMFDYCFNYGKIQNSVKHDQNSIEQTRNVILNAVNKELRERGENVTQNQTTQPQTNTTTNGGSENNNAGANNNTQNTSSTKESAIWVNLNEAEGDNADNGNSNNGIKITTNTNDVKDDNGNTVKQNTVAPGKSSTTEQDINLIVGKWITLCRCFTTAKLTAIQQIAKDFMNLIRAHLRSQNIKDTENPEEAAKGNKTEADQQNNNQNNNEKK